MANLLFVGTTGQPIYAVLLTPSGAWWNSGFEAYDPGHWTGYAVTVGEVGASGVYAGVLPTGLPDGAVVAIYRRRAGTFAGENDVNVGVETLMIGQSELDQIAGEVGELLSQVVGVAT